MLEVGRRCRHSCIGALWGGEVLPKVRPCGHVAITGPPRLGASVSVTWRLPRCVQDLASCEKSGWDESSGVEVHVDLGIRHCSGHCLQTFAQVLAPKIGLSLFEVTCPHQHACGWPTDDGLRRRLPEPAIRPLPRPATAVPRKLPMVLSAEPEQAALPKSGATSALFERDVAVPTHSRLWRSSETVVRVRAARRNRY